MEANLVDRTVEEEYKRPKFLAHAIFPEHYHKKSKDDALTHHNHALDITEKLLAGEAISYIPTTFKDEFAFSLHVENPNYADAWGYKQRSCQGLIIFNDRFCDKISSEEVTDTTINNIACELANLERDYNFSRWNSHSYTDIGAPPNQGHRILFPNTGKQNWNLFSRLVYHRAYKIREFDKWLEYKGTNSKGEPLLVPADIASRLITLQEHLKSVNGTKISDFIEAGNMGGRIMGATEDIMNVRKGIQRSTTSADIGVRAVKLSVDGDLQSLPINREDIRYLFSWHGCSPASANLIISPNSNAL